MIGTLVLLRHGQSEWNVANRFTGWHDVALTKRGLGEAREAGSRMAQAGLVFDRSHTSLLTRATVTHHVALEALGQPWLPVQRHWRLNERHYGALQGLNKTEVASRFGEKQTNLWRRSYDVPPPPVDITDAEHPRHDPRYDELPTDVLPRSECLRDVGYRVLPYWFDTIAPQLLSGHNVLVTAHGNSLRALIKHIEGISDTSISDLNLPTGIPRVYSLDSELHADGGDYLATEAELRSAIEEVASQADPRHRGHQG